MSKALFVTGTGTGVGKTYITQQLLKTFAHKPINAVKPLITGWDEQENELDTHKLLQAMGKPMGDADIDTVSPFRFKAPLSPDQAAAYEGKEVDFVRLIEVCQQLMQKESLLIEGVGGVMVPLTSKYTVLDWIKALDIPVLLVAGSYLGTLSHTLTAFNVLKANHVVVAGIVVNQSIDCVGLKATLKSLESFCEQIPLIGWPRHQTLCPKSLHELAFFHQLEVRTR